MRVVNGQVEPVTKALVSVLSGVILPISDAEKWADVLVNLGAAQAKIQIIEQPIFNGTTELNIEDNPEAMARLSEFRAVECGVDIPTMSRMTLQDSTGNANPVHLALLVELGVIVKEQVA